MKQRLLFSVIAVGWIAFWFWAFSYALSDGFFEYNRYSRIPTFLSALASVIVVPASAMCLWRAMGAGTRSPAAALGIHLLVVVAALALPLAITHVLARAPQPWDGHRHLFGRAGIGRRTVNRCARDRHDGAARKENKPTATQRLNAR